MSDISGTADRDILVGGDGPDLLAGLSGNDDLVGLGGNDELQGGVGDDHLYGGTGADRLDGGPGSDLARYDGATAGLVVDLLLADRNSGEALGDLFFGIEGLVGSAFGDELNGDDGGNLIFGSDGADAIYGRGGADNLVGGSGLDELFGEGGDDHLYPGGDSDYFVFLAGGNIVDGGDGFDFVHYDHLGRGVQVDLRAPFPGISDLFNSVEGVVGTNFNDSIVGTSGANWLYGLGGDDFLWGMPGDDVLLGGPGRDTLEGHDGNDWLYGGEGDDRLNGDAGDDVLIGEAGNDRLVHRSGRDILHGGDGDDLLIAAIYEAGSYNGGEGVDTVDYSGGGWAGAVTIIDLILPGAWGTETHSYDSIENIIGTPFRDSLRGNASSNRLEGSGGDDILYGRSGDDVLVGGNGSDVLFGNEGDDLLIGNGAAANGEADFDGFYFGAGDGHDTIQGFQPGTGLGDVVYLSSGLGLARFEDVMSKATEVPGGVLITLAPTQSILITGVSLTSLVADDFGFF